MQRKLFGTWKRGSVEVGRHRQRPNPLARPDNNAARQRDLFFRVTLKQRQARVHPIGFVNEAFHPGVHVVRLVRVFAHVAAVDTLADEAHQETEIYPIIQQRRHHRSECCWDHGACGCNQFREQKPHDQIIFRRLDLMAQEHLRLDRDERIDQRPYLGGRRLHAGFGQQLLQIHAELCPCLHGERFQFFLHLHVADKVAETQD